MPDLEISIVIVSRNSERTIRKCLNSLIGQPGLKRAEIILVDSSTDNTPKIAADEFPAVRLFHFTQRKFPGEARNFGNSQAKGKIIACIDSDCIAGEGWVNAIMEAHRSVYAVIGGPVRNANPESFFGWAAYLCWFGQVLPKVKPFEADSLPTCNVSYKKWVFEKYGGFMGKSYSHDTVFNWNLRKNGEKILFSPFVSVAHINSVSFIEFIKYGIVRGRDFGVARAAAKDFSRLKAAVYLLFSFMLPIVLTCKYVIRVLASTIPFRRLLLVFPLVPVGSTAWSIGEFLGYAGYFAKRE